MKICSQLKMILESDFVIFVSFLVKCVEIYLSGFKNRSFAQLGLPSTRYGFQSHDFWSPRISALLS